MTEVIIAISLLCNHGTPIETYHCEDRMIKCMEKDADFHTPGKLMQCFKNEIKLNLMAYQKEQAKWKKLKSSKRR